MMSRRWFSLQQFFPGYRFGEDLTLQPQVIVHLKVFRQVHPLSEDTLQTVVHRQEVRIAVTFVVATTVEAFDIGPQSALLGLEVPGTGVQIWSG